MPSRVRVAMKWGAGEAGSAKSAARALGPEIHQTRKGQQSYPRISRTPVLKTRQLRRNLPHGNVINQLRKNFRPMLMLEKNERRTISPYASACRVHAASLSSQDGRSGITAMLASAANRAFASTRISTVKGMEAPNVMLTLWTSHVPACARMEMSSGTVDCAKPSLLAFS